MTELTSYYSCALLDQKGIFSRMSKTYVGTSLYPRRKAYSLRELLEMVAGQYPEVDAYIYRKEVQGKDYHVTYSELREDVEAFAAGLAKQLSAAGKTIGEARIAVIGANSYPWVVAFNAACSYLGTAVPLDAQLPIDEALNLIERSQADVLCFDDRHEDLAQCVAQDPGSVKLLVSLTPGAAPEALAASLAFDSVLKEGRALAPQESAELLTYRPQSEDLASLIFTSGTTSQSKGVMLSHRNIALNAHSCAESFRVQPGDHALSVLPLHHTYENTVGMFTFWYLGLTICINDGLRYISKNMKDWEVLCMMVVPAIAENIHAQIMRSLRKQKLERKFRRGQRLSRFVRLFGKDKRRQIFHGIIDELGGKFEFFVCGGAPIDPEVVLFYESIGIECLPGYGLSEASPVLATNVQGNCVPGTVGFPLPDVHLKIDDSELTPDGKGHKVGEVLALGDNIMMGYLDDPEATAMTIASDGWLHTGDLGYFDDKGALHLTGRKKCMLVLNNGKKAFPEEIEGLLKNIPAVKEAFVWAEESKRGNTIICARIQIDVNQIPAEARSDDDEISHYLHGEIQKINKQMPVYKSVTAFIWTEDNLEMTTTLKVRRPQERENIRQILDQKGLSIQEASGMRLPPATANWKFELDKR